MSSFAADSPTARIPLQGRTSTAAFGARRENRSSRAPFKAHPALVVPSGGPLHQIHRGCGERISQRKLCPTHGELTAAEIGRAFEYAPSDRIALSDEELNQLAPTDDQTIQIEHLVPGVKFEMTMLSGRTLYLAPLHGAGEAAYAQAVAALGRVDTWAVGRMVLSEQDRIIAIRVEQGRPLLFVLHWPEHRRAYSGPEVDAALATPAELRALEKGLVPLHRSFVCEAYRDESPDRLSALVQTKVAARSAVKRPQGKSPGRRSRQAACCQIQIQIRRPSDLERVFKCILVERVVVT